MALTGQNGLALGTVEMTWIGINCHLKYCQTYKTINMMEIKQSINPSLIQQAESTYRSYQNVSEEPKAMEQREETLPKEAAQQEIFSAR